MRPPHLVLVLAAAAVLALPAGAQASADYVVSLQVDPGTTCADVVRDVTTDHAVTPGAVYASALCGFAATLRRGEARELAADPRVLSVQADAAATA